MKRIVLALSLILFIVSANAQSDYQRKMALGFIASPSISWLNTNDANIVSDGSITGFKFGINGDFYFTPNYAFNTGLFLNKIGGKLKYNQEPSDITLGGTPYTIKNGETVEYQITYLEIPLSLKLQTPDFNRMLFFGRFGFSPMVKTGAQNAGGLNITDEVALFNMNYHIGGGMEYFVSGNTGITFSVIYTNGIIDVTQNQNGRNDNSTIKSVEFVFGLNF